MKQKPQATYITSSTQYYTYGVYTICLFKYQFDKTWGIEVKARGSKAHIGEQTTAAQALAAAVEYCDDREAGTI
jgi:hypothetical protein